MKGKDLINWASLSEVLTGRPDVVRKGRRPKKLETKINKAIDLMDQWLKENK